MRGPPYRGGDISEWRATVARASRATTDASFPPVLAARSFEAPDNSTSFPNGVPGARSFATMNQLRAGLSITLREFGLLSSDGLIPGTNLDLVHTLCQDLADSFWMQQRRLRRRFGIVPAPPGGPESQRAGNYIRLSMRALSQRYMHGSIFNPYLHTLPLRGDRASYFNAIKELMQNIDLPLRAVRVGEGLPSGRRAAPHWAGPRLTNDPECEPRLLNVSLELQGDRISSLSPDGAIEIVVTGLYFHDDWYVQS